MSSTRKTPALPLFRLRADGDAIEFLRKYHGLSFRGAPKRTGKELSKPYRRALEDIKEEVQILAAAGPREISSMSSIPRAGVVALMRRIRGIDDKALGEGSGHGARGNG